VNASKRIFPEATSRTGKIAKDSETVQQGRFHPEGQNCDLCSVGLKQVQVIVESL
jgi:hypothetical protein